MDTQSKTKRHISGSFAYFLTNYRLPKYIDLWKALSYVRLSNIKKK